MTIIHHMKQTPNEALKDKEVRIDVLHTNMDKNRKNVHINNDLVVGDHVRVGIANYFKKGTEDRWSDEIYTIEGVKEMSVTLSDDKTYQREKLLKIQKTQLKSLIPHTLPNQM